MVNEVRNGEELDSLKLKAFLFKNEVISDNMSSLEISQFSNGFSNLTYLLKFENKECVLRRPPVGAIKRGHDMGREYQVLSQLNPYFSKAPKTLAFEPTGGTLGVPFYLMEKVEGVALNLAAAKKHSIHESEFKLISETWLSTYVDLHNVDYKEAGLESLGRPVGYVNRQVTNWGKQYYKAATREIPEANYVIEWMAENQPLEYDHSLIHNDYKYDNVLFDQDDWSKIHAVLDWEMCTLGDPLMDLGTSLAYWTMASDGPMVLRGIPSPTMLPGNPSRSDIVESYSNLSGRPVDNLVFYYVYGLFKIAVIAQQIYYRYEKGLTQNEKFAKLDEACEFLCQMAKQAILKNRIENLFE